MTDRPRKALLMTATITYGDALARHDVAIPAHLIADAEVPALAGLQRQGDLLIVPRDTAPDGMEEIPAAGVQVVVGEATGNTHWLDGAGLWQRLDGDLDEVAVVVPDGGVAVLTHTEEHGANAMAPGSYVIRRQRQQADVVRVVAD